MKTTANTKMRAACLVLIAQCCMLLANGQVSVNNDGSAPHSSAQLEVKSTNKGLLIPRVKNPATDVSGPAAGLILYNTTSQQPNYFNGSAWLAIGGGNRFTKSVGFTGPIGLSPDNYTELNWEVPAGVTEILVELWGGGDAGSSIDETITANDLTGASGGDAGDYAAFVLSVSPGQSLLLRIGGAGGATSYTSGGNTTITAGASTYEVRQLGAFYINNVVSNNTTGLLQFNGGQDGKRSWQEFQQSSSTVYRRVIHCGDGGSAYPNQAGGDGTVVHFNAATGAVLPTGLASAPGNVGATPGGGGGAGFGIAGSGGRGMIIIHY